MKTSELLSSDFQISSDDPRHPIFGFTNIFQKNIQTIDFHPFLMYYNFNFSRDTIIS